MEHEKDMLCQQKTWISNCHPDVRVIYLRGWNEKFYFEDKDVLFVPCSEEYSLILTKTVLGLKYISENYRYDLVIRSNVSTYFETHRLIKEVSQTKYQDSFFGGYFDQSSGDINDMKRSFEYISGAGMFFSKDIVGDLIQLDPQKFVGIADDLAISSYLFALGKNAVRIKRNNLHATHVFFPSFYIRTKNSFDYNSASKRMFLIHNYFMSHTWLGRFRTYCKIASNEFREIQNYWEGLSIYLAKNRVIFISYIKAKL
jgi:hypothetical protein